MRELTLLETGYLAGLLLLSLILPLLLSFRGPQDLRARKACLKIVWIGQLLGALAGLLVLTSSALAPYAAALAALSIAGCAVMQVRKFRPGNVL